MTEFIPSPQQADALIKVGDWLRTRSDQVFRLLGFAGTGKTTLAQHLAADVERVLFAAYTGKAALVMRKKGCGEASTIHRLIYHARDTYVCPSHPFQDQATDRTCRECGKPLVQRPKFTLNRESLLAEAKLLIVDECSMVGEQIGHDLLSFGVPVLVLGDPFQLPPPAGCGFFTSGQPDVLLTEIHRQALDNPIIRMSMDVRAGRHLDIGEYGESRIIPERDVQTLTAADQVLVGRNDTRVRKNAIARRELGRTDPLPMVGDKLVCLRNNHRKGLLNGSLWIVETLGGTAADKIRLRVRPEDGGDSIEVVTHAACLLGHELSYDERKRVDEFTYGNVLTVHKAQGSQWDHVLIFDESAVFQEEAGRWLYTAITRAAERVTLVKGSSSQSKYHDAYGKLLRPRVGAA